LPAVSRLGVAIRLVLQLPLQGLDLLGERVVGADQVLDLAYRVQDGGVIAAAEPTPDLRQRAQRQGLGEMSQP